MTLGDIDINDLLQNFDDGVFAKENGICAEQVGAYEHPMHAYATTTATAGIAAPFGQQQPTHAPATTATAGTAAPYGQQQAGAFHEQQPTHALATTATAGTADPFGQQQAGAFHEQQPTHALATTATAGIAAPYGQQQPTHALATTATAGIAAPFGQHQPTHAPATTLAVNPVFAGTHTAGTAAQFGQQPESHNTVTHATIPAGSNQLVAPALLSGFAAHPIQPNAMHMTVNGFAPPVTGVPMANGFPAAAQLHPFPQNQALHALLNLAMLGVAAMAGPNMMSGRY